MLVVFSMCGFHHIVILCVVSEVQS